MTTNARIWMQRAKICISWFFIFFTSLGWLASMYFSLSPVVNFPVLTVFCDQIIAVTLGTDLTNG